jgi:hypothetical protein
MAGGPGNMREGREMRERLTYANVVSTLCLFILLGGGAYAAVKLPKSSVGTKQLKKNAVTTAKIRKEAVTGGKVKHGTLTGKQIDASTLGEVPASAKAGDATTLGGIPGTDFARSSRFLFGSGDLYATTTQTLLTAPGAFLLRTDGTGSGEYALVVEGLSPDKWDFILRQDGGGLSSNRVMAGEHGDVQIGLSDAGIVYGVDTVNTAKQAVIHCVDEFNTGEILCSALLSPAV